MGRNNLKKLHQFLKDNKTELRAQGINIHDGHKLPQSRRDLLAMGVYAAGYTALLPSAGALLMQAKAAKAQGLTCPEKPLPVGVPFLQIHASGGWLTRDIIHGLKGNGFDKEGNWERPGGGMNVQDYYEWGLAGQDHPSVRAPLTFGGHLVPHHSAALLAARDYYGTEDLSTTRLNGMLNLFSFNHRSPDDSSATQQNFLASAAKLRSNTGDFPVVSTSEGTDLNGVNALPAFTQMQKSNVIRGNDISNLVNVGDIAPNLRTKLVETISNRLARMISNKEAQFAMGCSTKVASDLVTQYSQQFDPAAAFPSLATSTNDVNLRTMAGMLFSGLSSCGGVSLGGYDYHGNGAQAQSDRNFALWRNTIIPMADAAIQEGKNVIFGITSDGSVRCSVSETEVTTTLNGLLDAQGNAMAYTSVQPDGVGDFGRNGTTLLIAIGNLPPESIKYHQVGHALARGGVAREGNLIGYDQVASSSAILETIRRLMLLLNAAAPLTAGFEDAANMRFSDALEEYVPVKIG